MAKDFKGHFESDDPRNVVWSAGGCTWPTVPAYRYRMYCSGGGGLWLWLRTAGLLMEANHVADHDDMTWESISGLPFYLTSVWMWRQFQRDTGQVRWTLFFNSPFVGPVIEVQNYFDAYKKCNVDIAIDNSAWDWPPISSPGEELSLRQVYYDEDEPPP
jgi:hypothetical protein